MSRNVTAVCLVVLMALPATRIAAADWYSAPGAPPVAEGTREDPLELATLLGPGSPARAGDTIYLGRETPAQWENPGAEPARLLWITIH